MHITPKRTQIILDALQNKHNAEYCQYYGERGYQNPDKGIIFCNWNDVSRAIQEYLEDAGYELEWCDEWYIDYDYSKAYRTSPDSYGWVSQIAYTVDGEVLTPDDDVSAWVDEMQMTDKNHPRKALPDWISQQDIENLGFQKINGNFETGFHTGQNDDPKAVAKQAFDNGAESVVFRIEENSQFYTVWQAYAKFTEDDE